MRRLMFLAAALAACEPDTRIAQTEVLWMEWPAQVGSGEPFTTRLVMYRACGWEVFRPGTSIDESAVTFSPYFAEDRSQNCPIAHVVDHSFSVSLDTTSTVAGLIASPYRTYEMRAAAAVFASALGVASGGLPVRTFGDVEVYGSLYGSSGRRKAGGRAYQVRDNTGCLRLQPLGVGANGALPIENPADTVQNRSRFVRGYSYDAATPVCGETKVFHLESVN